MQSVPCSFYSPVGLEVDSPPGWSVESEFGKKLGAQMAQIKYFLSHKYIRARNVWLLDSWLVWEVTGPNQSTGIIDLGGWAVVFLYSCYGYWFLPYPLAIRLLHHQGGTELKLFEFQKSNPCSPCFVLGEVILLPSSPIIGFHTMACQLLKCPRFYSCWRLSCKCGMGTVARGVGEGKEAMAGKEKKRLVNPLISYEHLVLHLVLSMK